MPVVTDILINVAASLIFFVIGYLTNKTVTVLSLKRIFGRFWQRFFNDSTLIIVPTLTKNASDITTISLLYSELKIGSMIDEILRKFNKNIILQEEKFAVDKLMNYNLILIGSPSTNKLIKEIFEDITIPIDFKDNKLIYKKEKEFETIYDEENLIVEDYGVIILDTNYYNPIYNMVIIAGNTPIGTYNAAKVISKTKSLRRILKYKYSNNFLIFIKTKIIDNFMSDPEIILVESFKDHIL